MVRDDDRMAEGRAFATGLQSAAAWFNRLERCADALNAAIVRALGYLGASEAYEDAAIELEEAYENLKRELYGDNGADHPDAAPVDDAPAVPPDMRAACMELTRACTVISEAHGQLKIDGPVTDAQVQAFVNALYEVQVACQTAEASDKSLDDGDLGDLPGEARDPSPVTDGD